MANPFVKAWKYVMALFNSKIDEHADPKVQIQQAIEEAQRQHQALTQQAASVIGNQRQLEMRLNRQLADIEKLQVNVRQAVTLADQSTAADTGGPGCSGAGRTAGSVDFHHGGRACGDHHVHDGRGRGL